MIYSRENGNQDVKTPILRVTRGRGRLGTGGSSDQVRGGHWSRSGTQIGEHRQTGRNTGIVGESERRWIMDQGWDISALVTAGQEMGSHGIQRGNKIVLRRFPIVKWK